MAGLLWFLSGCLIGFVASKVAELPRGPMAQLRRKEAEFIRLQKACKLQGC